MPIEVLTVVGFPAHEIFRPARRDNPMTPAPPLKGRGGRTVGKFAHLDWLFSNLEPDLINRNGFGVDDMTSNPSEESNCTLPANLGKREN
jgi:hypothetical protein